MNKRELQPPMTLIPRALAEAEDGLTIYQISDIIGVHIRNIRCYLKLLKEAKTVRICEWTRNGSNAPMPVYGLGAMRDTRKPEAQSLRDAKQLYLAKYRTVVNVRKRLARRKNTEAVWRGATEDCGLRA